MPPSVVQTKDRQPKKLGTNVDSDSDRPDIHDNQTVNLVQPRAIEPPC